MTLSNLIKAGYEIEKVENLHWYVHHGEEKAGCCTEEEYLAAMKDDQYELPLPDNITYIEYYQ